MIKVKRMIVIWLVMIIMGGMINGMCIPTDADYMGNEVRSVSTSQSKSYTSHAPIYINGNSDFSDGDDDGVSNPEAAGTEDEAYIIEGWDIDLSYCEEGVWVENTDAYFIIRNCYIHGDKFYYGIWFRNVTNGKIDQCIFENTDSIQIGSGSFGKGNSSNIIITNCVLYNGSWCGGISLSHVSNSTLANITMHDNRGGISVSGLNNTIINCTLYNSTGIGLMETSYSTVENCNVSQNNRTDIYLAKGISISDSDNNTIIDCTSSNNYIGIGFSFSSDNTITNCAVDNNSYGVTFTGSSNNLITNCAVASNNSYGIHMWHSLNNRFADCNIDSNDYGIKLYNTSECIITDCNISNNSDCGIYISNSSDNNHIYHNKFIDNANQSYDECTNYWDNGYPSGGNYWDDYTGVDLYSGVNQDEPGSDGIGDTPCSISGGTNQDHYPLMGPVAPNNPPIASFTYVPITPTTSDIIEFTDLSYDPDGIVFSRFWEFGDGNNSTLQNPTHQYPNPGNYTANLTVTDDDGATDRCSKMINVSALVNQPPIVNITYPAEGQTVSGTIIINGTVSDPDGAVQKVEVKIDEGNWQLAEGTTFWTFEWNTAAVSNGWHTTHARSYDGVNYSETRSIDVYVDNSIEICVDDNFIDDPANHTWNSVQEGIDDANEGDTVYVYSGTYYENIVVNKVLTLIGEDRNTTIIDGGGIGDVVYISADWVNMSGFGVRNSGSDWNDVGIELYKSNSSQITNCAVYNNSCNGIWLTYSSNNQITNCTVYNNDYGIYLRYSSNNNTVTNCSVYHNDYYGIELSSSNNNQIRNCSVYNNSDNGIRLSSSSNNQISNCSVYNNGDGIYLESYSDNNQITNCTVSNDYYGIWFKYSSNYNHIYHNNFIDNTEHAYEMYCGTNYWDDGYPSGGNYWSDYTGNDSYSGENQNQSGSDRIGDTPYSIPGGSNQDRYPLLRPAGWVNTPPTLTSASYSMHTFPRSTIPDIFKVTYTDPDNDEPEYIKLVVDDVEYYIDVVVDKEEIEDEDYTDGVTYFVDLDLTTVAQTKTVLFYFTCSDGVDEVMTEEQAIDVWSTGFTPQENGYSFKNNKSVFEQSEALSKISSWSYMYYKYVNYKYVEGLCYGMSYTSILYYQNESRTPAGKSRAYDLNITTDEDVYNNILRYHYTQPLTMNNELAKGLSFEEKAACYNILKNQTKTTPWVLGVSYIDEESKCHKHAVVVYKIVESDDFAYLYIYDPNHPYGDGEEYFIGKVDLLAWSFSYLNYDRFSVLKPGDVKDKTYFEFNFIAIAHSPVEVHVYDKNSNHVGLDNEGKLEFQIPGAYVEEVDDDFLFIIPETAGSLRWVINGTGSGSYSFELSIPTKGDCLRVYTINTTTTANAMDTMTISSDGNVLDITTGETGKTYSLNVVNITITAETFTITGITINSDTIHSYIVNDWGNLGTGANPVTLGIDTNSDGTPEHTVDLHSGMMGEDIENIITEEVGKDRPPEIPWQFYTIIPVVIIIVLAGIGLGVRRRRRKTSPPQPTSQQLP